MKRKNRLNTPINQESTDLGGVLVLFAAYLIWGLSPIYWKLVAHVSSFELLMHRTVWSLVFLLVIIYVQKRGRELIDVLKNPRQVGMLVITTLLLALNWYLFIWAINTGRVLQTSLAYYMNPLLMVFLGMIFLNEKLSRLQFAALVIASLGVGYYTFSLGQFPWLSVVIAVTFGVYGLIHKLMPVLPLPGLCIETLILSVPAAGYLIVQQLTGKGAMFAFGWTSDLLLIGTCLVTGLPLLFFTIGAKRTTLTTVGFMQYVAPCCTFGLAVFIYHEAFSVEKLIAFSMIWAALSLYSIDSVLKHRLRKKMEAMA